jgi:hypothetical protein
MDRPPVPFLAPVCVGLLALACNDHTLAPPNPIRSRTESRVTLSGVQKLDIVFMIDDSDSMKEEQGNLIRNFPLFMKALREATSDSPLDVHIGVISSDLGAGPQSDVCRLGGDGGAFQHAARGNGRTCTAVPRGSFIAASPGGHNFDGPIEDVFSCIAELGHDGCGFEHQLASLRRALGGDPKAPMPAENAGFLRPDARLGIVLITDEDDCSAPPDTDLFSGFVATLTDRYGPLENYRCNEFGHLCGGSPPPRRAGVVLTDCVSNETPTGKLIPIAEIVTFLRTLKPNPEDLVVATITGPNTRYETRLSSPSALSGAGERYIEIAPACSSANGSAAPAVRLQQFTQAFGKNGILRSICIDDFRDVMAEIALHIIDTPPFCVRGRLLDSDPAAPGLQADCAVTVAPLSAPASAGTVIAACDRNGHQPPCWRVQAALPRCDALAVTVDWGAEAPSSLTRIQASCAVCAGDADPDPGCR